MTVRDILESPITLGAGAITALVHLLPVPLLTELASVAWTNIPSIFTLTSISAFTIGQNVQGVPAEPLIAATVVVGVAYAFQIGLDIYRDAETELEDNQ